MKLAILKIIHPLDGAGREEVTQHVNVIRLTVSEDEWIRRVQKSGFAGSISEYAIVDIPDPKFKRFPELEGTPGAIRMIHVGDGLYKIEFIEGE